MPVSHSYQNTLPCNTLGRGAPRQGSQWAFLLPQMMGGSLRSTGMVMGLRGQLPMATQAGLSGPAPPMATTSRYPNPGPIQRPPSSQGTATTASHRTSRGGPSQGPPQPPQPTQRTSNPPSSAQQAKLRADALSTTQAFFNRDGE